MLNLINKNMRKFLALFAVFSFLFSTQLVYAIDAPSNLLEVSKTSNSIDFQFTDESDNETFFALFLVENGVFNVVYSQSVPNSSVQGLLDDNTQTPQNLNFEVTDLDSETEYCYALKSSNNMQTSSFSNTLCVTTLAATNSVPEFDFVVLLFVLLVSGYLMKEKLSFVS